MKQLFRVHLVTILIYIGGVVGGICILIMLDNLLHIQMPMWILALIEVLCLSVSASLRLFTWGRRNEFLTEQERNCFGTKVFIFIAYIEILVAVISGGLFLLAPY